MWNSPLMWNSPKMWNRPKEVEQRKDQQYLSVLLKKMGVALDVGQVFDVEQPKEVELVQRGGTGPKINRTFSVEMEQRYQKYTERIIVGWQSDSMGMISRC